MLVKSLIVWACRQLFGTVKGELLSDAIYGRFGAWISATEASVIARELSK